MREEMFFDVQRWRRNVVVILSLFFTGSVYGVTFEVSNSDELQAALTTAASNGGDDEIVLAAGRYEGNFTYRATEAFGLRILGDQNATREEVVLDGLGKAFVVRVLGPNQPFDLEFKNLTITGGRSEESGGGLSLINFREFNSNERFNVLESGLLRLNNIVVQNNFAPRAGGVFVSGWVNIELLDSLFIGNSVNPGGSGSHVLFEGAGMMSLEEVTTVEAPPYAIIRDNLFLETGEVSLGGGFSGSTAIVLNNLVATSPLFSLSEIYFGINVSFNRFERMGGNPACLGTVERIGCEFGGFTTASFLQINSGGSGIEFWNNTAKDFVFPVGASLSGSKVSVRDNRFLSGASLGASGKIVNFQNNLFDGSDIPINAQAQSFKSVSRMVGGGNLVVVEGNQIKSGFVSIGQSGVLFSGEGQSGLIVSNNLVWKSPGDCGINMFGSESVEVHNNTVVGGNANGICVDTTDKTKLLIANNISYANAVNGSGVDIKRIGYGDESILRNNVYESASEIWDIFENNFRSDPNFYDVDSGDLHVSADSVALNSGSLEGLSAIPEFDLDGTLRVLEGVIDIGAYERSTTALHPADTNGDSSISSAEFEAYNSAWRANEAWTTSPVLIPVDFVTRAGYLLQKGGSYKNIGVGKPATWTPVNE